MNELRPKEATKESSPKVNTLYHVLEALRRERENNRDHISMLYNINSTLGISNNIDEGSGDESLVRENGFFPYAEDLLREYSLINSRIRSILLKIMDVLSIEG